MKLLSLSSQIRRHINRLRVSVDEFQSFSMKEKINFSVKRSGSQFQPRFLSPLIGVEGRESRRAQLHFPCRCFVISLVPFISKRTSETKVMLNYASPHSSSCVETYHPQSMATSRHPSSILRHLSLLSPTSPRATTHDFQFSSKDWI